MWLCVVVHVRCGVSHFCLHVTLLARRVRVKVWECGRAEECDTLYAFWRNIYAETFVSICQTTWHLMYVLTYLLTHFMDQSPS